MTVFARSGFSVVSLERVHERRYGSLTKWVQRIQAIATPGLHVGSLGDSEFAEGLALCGPMPKREARTADRP
ncbi:MAG TPA: hypothetical protein VE487_11830 [Ilumatobacter sp.]|nr:hypothetical protein [Ilumatobacter sp.]